MFFVNCPISGGAAIVGDTRVWLRLNKRLATAGLEFVCVARSPRVGNTTNCCTTCFVILAMQETPQYSFEFLESLGGPAGSLLARKTFSPRTVRIETLAQRWPESFPAGQLIAGFYSLSKTLVVYLRVELSPIRSRGSSFAACCLVRGWCPYVYFFRVPWVSCPPRSGPGDEILFFFLRALGIGYILRAALGHFGDRTCGTGDFHETRHLHFILFGGHSSICTATTRDPFSLGPQLPEASPASPPRRSYCLGLRFQSPRLFLLPTPYTRPAL